MNIEEELSEISLKINSEDSQLRLQQLLNDKVNHNEISSSKAHELLQNISTNLTKSLLETKLYHMINLENVRQETKANNLLGKSILDLNGDFIWHDKFCEFFFQYSSNILLSSNIFSLMSSSSIRYLYSKYSQELLFNSQRVVISYILSNGVELSSRCTLVNFSPSPGYYKKGVLFETRHSRHKVLNYNSLSISPLNEYSDNNLVFTPIQFTPASFLNQETCVVDLESLRITPFLKSESPYKKRKIEDCTISEF